MILSKATGDCLPRADSSACGKAGPGRYEQLFRGPAETSFLLVEECSGALWAYARVVVPRWRQPDPLELGVRRDQLQVRL